MTLNHDIKLAARKAHVNLWQIAEAYGIVDSTFSRKLRHELPPEEKTKIFAIIKRLESERDGAVS